MRIGRFIQEVGSFLAIAKMARSIDTEDALLLARRLRWLETEDDVEDLKLAA